jgi:sterol desaturase/sphingolipid hydroxylase (fatty acid hydroxylase superfamily)
MEQYWQVMVDAYTGYAQYLAHELLYPSWHNYFYWLLGLSLLVWLLEIIFPWRTQQAVVRKDFWLDGFYMFFNFFLFSLIGYNAISNLGVQLFNDALAAVGLTNSIAINIAQWPAWAQYVLLFVLADFIQWNIHRWLHKSPWLWQFHKIHHSVEEMGFAAHLRFHWMETIIYKTIQYIPLAMIGYSLTDFFVVHIISVAIGHLNHSNINIGYGPLQYIFNNPRMHIWHHAKQQPVGSAGVNFGISLSIWDYLFKTVYMPADGRDMPLGFEQSEKMPKSFWQQMWYPFKKK